MKRLFFAFKHSMAGFRATFREETAFRIEVFWAMILLPTAYFLTENTIEFVLLVSGIFGILLAELLNSSIENTVDRISLEHHKLSKSAKDIGSAAVFLAIIYCLFVWIAILT